MNLDDLEQKVNKIDSATTKQNQLIYELNADLITEIENIKQELQELSAKFDDAQSEMRRLYQKLGARSYGYRSFQDSSLTKFNSEDRVDSEELYNNAYLDYTRGDFDQALNGFKSYLQYFPNTQFSDNAQYWIGECFYSKKMYREAIDEFQKVIENYPEGNKVVAALYKIGLCYELLGEYKKAKYYYQKVFSEYPGTQEAKLAEERYKKLN
ncbi:MAG: tol-pal system protein YbgF [candidate division WOR-3 bacterium]|nr:tol-pal system protein YbgF [candidate division WOR-3 bacterium]MCX7757476.1 tol-pal system protein YbgF [candidate division WOR-3 bacterium]MDW7987145.1 tol-pal system protein YbgF [candidate division WOR-3 bacterium]